MSKKHTWVDYQKQIDLVTNYIYEHLEEELDLFTLADVAHFSPHYWHRIYCALRKETAAATIKRLRLQRSAGYLTSTDLPVQEIAKRCGYPNLQSFTRIFAASYGIPPARYRKEGPHQQFQQQPETQRKQTYTVHTTSFSSLPTLALNHIGSYLNIGKAFDELFSWIASKGTPPATFRMFGLYHDDPTLIPENELRAEACIALLTPIAAHLPVHETTLASGNYAVLRYQGPYAMMQSAYQWFFGDWLLKNGRELAEKPIFEEYLNTPQTTAPLDLLTDIYFPLA